MRTLTLAWRLLRLIEHLITSSLIVLYIALTSSPTSRPPWLPSVACWWHRRLCRIIGLRLEVKGTPVSGVLMIANHISWMDIPVLGSQTRLRFLSKAEVRQWPLIGWMSELAGTLFIHRGTSHAATRASAQLSAELARGETLVIFPEGTTSDGRGLRRFHPRLLRAAQELHRPIQPVALRYGSNAAPDEIAPYIGDDALVPNVLRVIARKRTNAVVHFLEPLSSTDADRRRLAAQARGAIAEALEIDPEAPPIREYRCS